jgi:metallophosphoesterase superfamily enzyme
LGDLIHHEQSLNLNVEQKIASFREQYPCELILLRGNHDRYTTFPDSWGIVEENDFYIKNFYFSHEFQSGMKDFQFSGHVHPMIRLKGGYDELRFPAFILGQEFCLLPAFSYLTGGRNIRLQKGQEALIVTNSGMDLIRKV